MLAAAVKGSSDAIDDLVHRMAGPLAFGTAGLRGPLRAGPAGMNLAVIRRAAYGIGRYLLSKKGAGGTVVIGHDARHRSAEFAQDAACVLAAAGFQVLLAPAALPTPITAYAVRHLRALAGLQVTASHNPPKDNGLKVYLQGGVQLVGPADTDIETAIATAPAAVSINRSGIPESWPDGLVDSYLARAAAVGRTVGGVARTATVIDATPAVAADTVGGADAIGGADAVATQSVGTAPNGRLVVRQLCIAATPLHGVGGEILIRALHLAGFSDVHLVSSQAAPDADFSTVPFPNPEEPGATDELLALAKKIGADLAIATDPDADRCSIGVPGRDGTWRMLTGDEAGALLGERILAELDRVAHPDALVATTIVSSQLLGRIAEAHGVRYAETLTGFKWIVRSGDGDGTGLVFGYEEALGLAVDPDAVRDKDGISAAVLAARVVDDLKLGGRIVHDVLDDLAKAHGLHTTGAVSLRVPDVSLIARWMIALRASPPDELLGEKVDAVEDLLPRTDGVRIKTRSIRVVVRPSGTEPKLKCYLEIVRPVFPGADLSALRAASGRAIEALRVEVADRIQQPQEFP